MARLPSMDDVGVSGHERRRDLERDRRARDRGFDRTDSAAGSPAREVGQLGTTGSSLSWPSSLHFDGVTDPTNFIELPLERKAIERVETEAAQWFNNASAMMLRAEFPVQRNRALTSLALDHSGLRTQATGEPCPAGGELTPS